MKFNIKNYEKIQQKINKYMQKKKEKNRNKSNYAKPKPT